MTETLTCINCPMGCLVSVEKENGEIKSITGNACKRGESYARQESVQPMRMITASVKLANRDVPVSVKTAQPVPKEKIGDCMEVLRSIKPSAPLSIGETVVRDICGTGINVIVTRNVE